MDILNKAKEVYTLYIYDEISAYGVNGKTVADALDKIPDGSVINVRVNSGGGNIFDGFAIANLIRDKARKNDITTFIDGIGASASSVIALATEKTYIATTGFLMIHSPYVLALGNADELRKQAETLDGIEEVLVKYYVDRTGMPYDELAQMVKDETWLNADQATEMGFVTGSFEAVENSVKPVYNKAILDTYNNVPDELAEKPCPMLDKEEAGEAVEEEVIEEEIVEAEDVEEETGEEDETTPPDFSNLEKEIEILEM